MGFQILWNIFQPYNGEQGELFQNFIFGAPKTQILERITPQIGGKRYWIRLVNKRDVLQKGMYVKIWWKSVKHCNL